MVENTSIQGLFINLFFVGLFLFSMVAGYTQLAANEGRGEIFDDYEQFEGLNLQLSTNLGNTIELGNANNQLSADYDPEKAISAADQTGNAMGINTQNMTMGVWNSVSAFSGLIFGNVWVTGLSGLLSGLLITLFGLAMIRFIRRGD